MMRILAVLVTGAIVAGSLARPAAQKSHAPEVDAAFQQFWAASAPRDAAGRVEAVLKTGVTFDEAYRRLKQGRTYAGAKTGIVPLINRAEDGVEHAFNLNIPESYDPSRTYQVRFQLHGGVSGRRDGKPVGPGTVGALTGDEQIYVVPYAWAAAPWWSEDQVLNLRAILDATKRLYNVDENRVVVSGVSDGGTGAYYIGMRDTTPYASILPLNGFMVVLAASDIDVDGGMLPNNLRNKPLFIVNGGRDPLYPTGVVEPYIDHLRKNGVSVDYHPQPNAGHNTAWWPDVKGTFEAFVRAHPRRPLPDTLTWETAEGSPHTRAHWLVIDTLGAPKGEAASLPDLNDMARPPQADFGTRSIGTRINRIVPGSNAERMGLKEGDVLMHVQGETVPSSVDVADALEDITPGATLELLVARNSLPVELSGVYNPPIAASPPRLLFQRTRPTGRVDLVRDGNTVRATTRGVSRFTLLLSPDQFDFGKPLKVVANGRVVFDGKVEKDTRTLLKYAASDNDRTMLFGAELRLDLVRD